MMQLIRYFTGFVVCLSVLCLEIRPIFSRRTMASRGYKDPFAQYAEEWSVVREGYRMAVRECRKQFRWQRWNCSLPQQLERGIAPVSLTGVLPTATKEAAFVHAIIAAAVTHNLITSCYLGNNDRCPCPRITRPNDTGRQWHMCRQDIDYGFKRAKRLIKKLDIKDVIGVRKQFNKRNAKIGFQALKESLPKVCRCHGATGSCTSRTCWRTLPRFERVGDDLRQMYNKAVRVINFNGTLYKAPKRSKRKIKRIKLVTIRKNAMIYFDASPDFCKSDFVYGTSGTIGRSCNPSEHLSCFNLCEACGYRTLKERKTVIDRKCKCQFQWCCKVVCQPCLKTFIAGRCVRKDDSLSGSA